ncbi:PREDICTED: disease resistance protein TAO1-like isoform X1 [Lupinus angustifolius]|uniref:disease resistance protein TAO1-like isoform X1 n=1 Tax=Lupinus angustifolius TaxID=3871 RepID=UPI00092F8A44|nr:PREDICTED: disease resistance protein TAO1-like isoform X1 [Lupinus angustifolius]
MASSSPPNAFHVPKKYDVFISFRGKDTRDNFVSHLLSSLERQKRTHVFIDYKLQLGSEISEELFKAIEDSEISIIVFSENYVSSRWCLDELVKIMECKKENGHDVIPVFYHVLPSQVRNQRGSYKIAFQKHAGKPENNTAMLAKWREAMVEAANLSGKHSCKENENEAKLIEEIVKDVLCKLRSRYPQWGSNHLFGINENLVPIESSFRDFPTIGIWGMGGMGKTTIARWLFNKHSSEFDGSCFFPNTRESSGDHDQLLHDLRGKLVSKLLDEGRKTEVDTYFIERELLRRKVMVVLDDVSTLKQVESLVGKLEQYGSGSRIIITTRDKDVLKKGVDKIHEVKALNSQDCFQLFCLKAFNQNHPKKGYEDLSKLAVDYAKSVPLALEVLGSFLYDKTVEEWESELKKLECIPNEAIQSVLKLSYDGLDDNQKEIFLEIAIFLRGHKKRNVLNLLVSYGLHAVIGLRTLQDKALITIREGAVGMHDLIQHMGHEIIRQESIDEPGRRSRLWDPEQIYDVLKEKRQGTNAVKGMRLDMSAIRDLDLKVDTFRKMKNLRFLSFYLSCKTGYSTLRLPLGLHLFSDKLSYIQWDRYPSKSFPLKFCPKKLGILLMPESRLRKLWDEVKDLQNLKIIDLNGSRQLKELPDFSLALNLEEIVLAGCERLCRVHSSIFSLHSLVVLNLDGCKKLKRLGGENLSEVLNLDLPSLERLSLSRSNIESLPASIKQCTKLIDLGLEDCKKLQYLPELPQSIQDLYLGRSNIERLPASIKQLTKLTKLFLTDCEKLRSLPPELPQFIKELALSGSNIESLPPSLTQLEKLTNLYLQDCNKLKSLPELPKSIELLDLSGTNNESLPPNLTQLEKLTNLYLKDCNKLKSLPELPKSIEILVLSGTDIESLPPSFTQLEKLTNLYLRDCNKLKSLPELPQSIKYLESNNCTLLVTAVTPEVFAPGGAPRGVPMINFVNCVKLDKQARCSILEKAYSSIRQIHHIDSVYEDSEEFLYACIFHICMPGSRIPKWFKHKTKTDSITIRVDQPLQIVACAYCVVLSPFPPNQGKETFFTIQCGKSISCWTLNVGRESNSCHVVLWAETFTRSTCTTSDLSFKFVVDGEINMERCGIFPIYANQGKPLDVPMDRKRKRMREE